jgi:hypothetical protein
LISKQIKQGVKSILQKAKIEVRRIPDNNNDSNNRKPDLPPIFDDPLAALAYEQVGRRAAFSCPLKYCLKLNGLSNWHPFVETLREYELGKITTYEGSVLEAYYNKHQPANASEAIVGFKQTPDIFRTQPAHVYRLSPWHPDSAEHVDSSVKEFTKEHFPSHDGEVMTLESDGFQYHGPVSQKKGQFEYHRLIQIYESIKDNGYNRELGHAYFLMLRRGKDVRFLARGDGNHRTAAMAALGHDKIPALFQRPIIFDIEMAEHWVQVQKNVWTHDQAVAYFNHLFDFDSRKWARKHNLISR